MQFQQLNNIGQFLFNDTTPLVNNAVTTNNTKQFSNINAIEPLTVDKAFSMMMPSPYILLSLPWKEQFKETYM